MPLRRNRNINDVYDRIMARIEERFDQFVNQFVDRMNDMINLKRRGDRNGQRSKDEESEYLFFEGDDSSDEWGDYGVTGDGYEGPPVFDDDHYEEEIVSGDVGKGFVDNYPNLQEDENNVLFSGVVLGVEEESPVYDTDIEDVIDGEEDNMEDVVVVANDLCSSKIQTTNSMMVVPAVENKGVEVNLRTSESALVPKRIGNLWVILVIPPEHSPEHLPKSFPTMFRCPSGYLYHHVPPVSYDHLLGPSSGLFFLQFDMHVYTSVLTFDEVKSLVAEYAIPLDHHPYVPPSSLAMNRLLADKIVPLGLNRLTMFEIYCRSLEINPFVNLFRAFYKLNKHGHWFSFERRLRKGGRGNILNEFCTSLKHWKDQFFLIDRRTILDAMPWRHQDSSMADPAPSSVCAEDIRRLRENIINLCPVHPAMLYAVGLTTIWKHVGHHLVFKDGERMVATSMSQFLKFRMDGGVRVGKGMALAANKAISQHTTPPLSFSTQIPEKSDHQKVVEYKNERVLATKRKAQAAKDRAVGKRAAIEGTS
ncbi:hypothetical protein Tco_0752667 [Tanacetum coccineum]|uniref:Uncharacterized protein n=1 Tax=Tanacetum coccineum TaxID=301880 RepID=A0ABQ4Z972_9ASTR